MYLLVIRVAHASHCRPCNPGGKSRIVSGGGNKGLLSASAEDNAIGSDGVQASDLDEAIRERLADLLGSSLIKNIQELVKSKHDQAPAAVKATGEAVKARTSKPPKPPQAPKTAVALKKGPRPEWKDDWTEPGAIISVPLAKERTTPNTIAPGIRPSSSSPSRRPPSVQPRKDHPMSSGTKARSPSPSTMTSRGNAMPKQLGPSPRVKLPLSNPIQSNSKAPASSFPKSNRCEAGPARPSIEESDSSHELVTLARLGAKLQGISEGGQSIIQEEIQASEEEQDAAAGGQDREDQDETYEDDFEQLSDGDMSNLGRVAMSNASNGEVSELRQSIAFVNDLIQMKIHRLTQDESAPDVDVCMTGDLNEDEIENGGEDEIQPEENEFEVPASPAMKQDLRSEAKHLFESLRTLNHLLLADQEEGREDKPVEEVLSPKDRLAGDVEWISMLMQNLSGSLKLEP